MIEIIRHKGLQKFYDAGETKFLPAQHISKIQRILSVLDTAKKPEDVDIPGFHLHVLKGELKEYYSVSITANWRIIFRFNGINVTDVDYLDYH